MGGDVRKDGRMEGGREGGKNVPRAWDRSSRRSVYRVEVQRRKKEETKVSGGMKCPPRFLLRPSLPPSLLPLPPKHHLHWVNDALVHYLDLDGRRRHL